MGVDLRVHVLFPLLLLLAVFFSESFDGGASRGVGLWLALCFAVAVREAARAIAAAYAGLQLRALLLLPVGGIMAFTPRNGRSPQDSTRLLALTGPIANFGIGLLLMGISYALEPHVSLLVQPWIGTSHVLRSFIWSQLLLGAVSLLPTPVMPSRHMLRLLSSKNSRGTNGRAGAQAGDTPPNGLWSKLGFGPRNGSNGAPNSASTGGPRVPHDGSGPGHTPGPAFGLGTGVALAMIIAGFVLSSLWLTILGGFMLLGAQLSSVQTLNSTEAEAILVREVMLTQYTLLNSSDTLQSALDRTVHSLQDVFPVVRGDRLVGSIARQTIAERLLLEGDGYLQGAMTRTLQLASPGEKLVEALRRSASLGASEFIPVVEGADMIGILTPQSLSRAVQQVKLMRPAPPATSRERP
jgi:predicted transcriptional regulator